MHNVSLPQPQDNWSGSVYSGDGRLWALGYPATTDGQQSLWAVDPTSGYVTVVMSGFKVYNGLLPCVFAVSADGKRAYWLSNFPGLQTMITVADTGMGKVTGDHLYRGDGAILALLAYTLPGNTSEYLLGLDIKGGRGPTLNSISPVDGTEDVMLTFPTTDLDDDDGSLAYDHSTGLAYLVLARDGGNGTVLRDLHTVDLTSRPVKVTTRPLALPSTVQGVFGLAVGQLA